MQRAVLLWVLTGCVVGDEAVPGEPDPGPTVPLAGRTIDYFTQQPVPGIEFETLGLAPERTGLSDPAGAYSLEVPIGSSFFVRTAATELIRPTVSDVVRTETADVAVCSLADIVRQHATVGIAVVPDTTTVFVELAAFDGTPIQGFARANLSIVEPASLRVIAAAPFVVGATGDVDPALESASGAVARFAFLNVEPGVHALVIDCPTCVPAIASDHTLISSAGVTLLHVTLGGALGPPADSFATIHPRFQHGTQGGLGCANCHTAGGPRPALDGPPAEVRAALLDGGFVDLTDPDRSALLARPLYETPADHPNASFLSASDPDYQAIRAWIAAGAN